VSARVGYLDEIPGIGHNGAPVSIYQDRPYQTDAVESIWDYFRTHPVGNPLVAMPTGTGKSVVIARFLQSVMMQYGNQRILILTHVKELIQQNYEKLMGLWQFAPAGIYSAGLGQRNMSQPITFAGIASVARKWAAFGHIDLVLIDEAHLMSPNDQTMYRTFLQGLKSINPYLRVIGLTATPWRMGHGHLIDPYDDGKGNLLPPLFSDVCFDLTEMHAFNDLFNQGYLIPLVPKKPKLLLDTAGLHTRGGEYIEKEMQEKFDRDDITEAALRECLEHGADRKHWLVFASGTDHADNVCDMLNMMGISAGCVHSKREGRDKTIQDFKDGKIQALVNNNVLTTGFDFPGIDFIIILRATGSAVLWVQILGRGIRPVYGLDGKGLLHDGYADLNTVEGRFLAILASGKVDCLVMDFARNIATLGPINDPVTPKAKGKGGGEAPVKECEVCETYNHASVRFCGGQPFKTALGCGAEFSFTVKFAEEAATDELIKFDEPVVEVFKVDSITIDKHTKAGSPPMAKVTYYYGYKHLSEFICIEHTNFAGGKARRWWAARTDIPMPATTDEAIDLMPQLAAPTHLRVHTNKKYPEILAFCYDGTAFGTQEASGFTPEIENREMLSSQKAAIAKPYVSANNYADDLDDDVPF
jgi:DNA repair protein RadD